MILLQKYSIPLSILGSYRLSGAKHPQQGKKKRRKKLKKENLVYLHRKCSLVLVQLIRLLLAIASFCFFICFGGGVENGSVLRCGVGVRDISVFMFVWAMIIFLVKHSIFAGI